MTPTAYYNENKLTIKSDKLSIDELENYHLNMLLSPHEFAFSVHDPIDKRCVRIESFIFPEIHIPGKNDKMLLEIFEDNQVLPAAFWKKINLFISNRSYSFIPKELYTEESAKQIIEFDFNWNKEKDTFISNEMDDFFIVSGYSVEINKFFEQLYPTREVNFKSSLISLITATKSSDNNASEVLVFQDEKLITIIVHKSGKFVFCNTYDFRNMDDAIYYTMLIYKELNLNPKTFPTRVFGNSENASILQSRLYKYIHDVELGKRPKNLKLCYKFDEIDESRFFGLLNYNEI